MKIGIFGGTFDPVHTGHLIIAELIREAMALDHVWFVPAPEPPHKTCRVITDFDIRAEMLELAVHANPGFVVSRIENTLPQPSFTVQTLRHLTDTYPQNLYFLIIGGDSFAAFRQWKDPESILKLCTPVVYPRPGYDYAGISPDVLKKAVMLPLPLMEISSTMIRERVRSGLSVRYLVPEPVANYIRARHLYR